MAKRHSPRCAFARVVIAVGVATPFAPLVGPADAQPVAPALRDNRPIETAPAAGRPVEIGTRLPSFLEREHWRRTMQAKRPARGCFSATFPDAEWKPVACGPDVAHKLYPPKAPGGMRTDTVGGSSGDFSAEVTGHVSQAEGSFDSVSGVTSQSAGAYTLQINTQRFSSQTCNAAPDSACRGWEQFVFDSSSQHGFIQYWLLNWGPSGSVCPTPRGAHCAQGSSFSDGWCPQTVSGFSDVLCVVNSADTDSVGSQPLTSLGQLRVTGEAGAGGSSDLLIVNAGNTMKSTTGGNFFPDLANQWQIAEFNVFGDGNSSAVNFNSGSTLVVRTSVDSGAASGPSCDDESFTAETNNLILVATNGTPPHTGSPSLVFTESNAPGSTPASCASAVSVGDTHMTTFDGLHYDFQASGEFVLVEDSAGFAVQARQASGAPTWPNASVNKAVAAEMGGTRVAFYIEPARVTVDGFPRIVNDGQTVALAHGVEITRKGAEYTASDEGGNSVRATLNPTWIDITVGLGRAPLSSARGLLGNPRGNGRALATSAGALMVEPVSFADLYHTYADSWRVKPGQSLFAEPLRIVAGIPSKPFFANQLDRAAAARAAAACRAEGVTNPALLEDCTLDTTVLNNRLAAKVFVRAQIPLRIVRPVAAVELSPRLK